MDAKSQFTRRNFIRNTALASAGTLMMRESGSGLQKESSANASKGEGETYRRV
jgi:hypothetical protein